MKRLIGGWTAALVVGSSLLLSAPAVSIAALPVPEDYSAANQYVESIPTSEGSKPAGVGKNGSVPPGLAGSAGNQAGQVKQLANSPQLGAPKKKLHGARADDPGVPSALVSAIGEHEGGNFPLLLLGLLLISGVVAGTAGHRHYRNRQTAGSA
jgi:hypothetical protein